MEQQNAATSTVSLQGHPTLSPGYINYVVDFFYIYISSGNSCPDLLNEFPDPKGLLNNTLSRSLGIADLSQYLQYSCTEHAGIKVRTGTYTRDVRFKTQAEF